MRNASEDCVSAPTARAHKLLQEMMDLLDQALPGDAYRELRTTLRDRGTSACAYARLGTEQEMEHDLTTMREAAARVEDDAAQGSRIAELRRLIDTSLAELRGH